MVKENAVLVIVILVPLCWVAAAAITGVDDSAPAVLEPALYFDASEAAATAREFSSRYPARTLGSIEARQSTGFIKERLERLGYEISYTHFDATVAGKRQVGRNVLAFKEGSRPEILAVAARYDTLGIPAAEHNDNSEGIGTLLELARIFAEKPARRTLLFLALDGNAWGALGAQDLAESYAGRKRLAAVISLDRIAAGNSSSLSAATAGQFAGGTPAWLRGLVRGSAAAAGIPLVESGGFREHLGRALPFPVTDQGPFLRGGIAAVNLGTAPARVAGGRTLDGIDAVGVVVEIVLRSLDRLPAIPREKDGGFRIYGNKVLSPRVMTVLHFLAFAPFAAMLVFQWNRFADDLDVGRLSRELLSLGATLVPFLLAYYMIQLVDRMRLLPWYSLYPPPAGDPVFSELSWRILAGLGGAVIAAAAVLYFLVRFLSRRLPRPDFNVSKLVCLVVSGMVVLAALLHNGYWAVSFLLLPACIAGLTGAGRGAGARTANRLLLLAGAAISCALFIGYGANPQDGVNRIWWELMALAGGMYSLPGYLLASTACALGLRFVVMQSHADQR